MYLDVSVPEDIWGKNPQIHILRNVKIWYEKVGEEVFNNIYYCVYLVHDPLSEMRRTTTDEVELRKEVKAHHASEEALPYFNWAELRPLCAEYKKNSITKEAKRFARLEEKVEQAEKFISKFKIEELGHIEDLDKAMKSFANLSNSCATAKKTAMEANKKDGGAMYGKVHGNIFK